MKKLILILVTLFTTQNILATVTVRVDDSSDPDFFLGSNELTSESAGDGSIISAPFKVYIPVNTSDSDQVKYHLFGSNIPLVSDDTSALAISVDLTSTISSETDLDLYLAIRNSSDTDFRVIKSYGYDISSSTDFSTAQATFTMRDLCLQTDIITCSNLSTGNSSSVEQIYYFFMRERNSVSEGDSVDLSDATNQGGVFFKAFFSNKLNDTFTITLNPIVKGDSSLVLPYSATSTISNFKEVAVFNGVTPDSTDLAGSGGSRISEDGEFPAVISANIRANDLINDQSYTLAVAFVDKYLFASKLSNTQTEAPSKIDTFLEKEQCYLLSAGFQESHYVIDYFKMIRDSYLLQSSWGKIFVNFYYSTAPSYTRMIYTSPVLSQIVRFFGYLAYFIFNFWMLVATPIIILISRKLMLAKR